MVLTNLLSKKSLCLCLLLFSCALAAEELVFSGKPAAGKNFLCTFSIQKSVNRKMEIRGAKEPPAQVQIVDFSLTGVLAIKENSRNAFIFQFTPDSFTWLEENKKQTAANFSKVKFDVALDSKGALRLFRVSPEQHPVPSEEPPPALKAALLQLGRSLQADPRSVIGPDSTRKIGEAWEISDSLLKTLAQNKKIASFQKRDWDSKVLFTRQEKFFDHFVNRIDVNLITNQIPGYDCRINMTYLFPVDASKKTGALSYVLDWMECVDKIMPDNNPIFSGTKMVEIMTMTIRRDLIPLNK